MWVEFTTLLVNNPILIVGLLVIAGMFFGFGWLFRYHTSEGTIRELNTRIDGLQLKNNEHVAALRERLAHAQEEQGRITKRVESLQAENEKLVSTIEKLKAASLPAPQQAQVTLLTTGTSQMAITISDISVANAEVGQALSRIAMEVRNLTPPSRDDSRWKPIETLPRPVTPAETITVWLLPRDKDLLPRQWVLAPDTIVPNQFSHWQDCTE